MPRKGVRLRIVYTLTLMDGSRYEGEFSDGKLNGPGTVFAANGSSATGTWKDGQFDAAHAHYRDPDGREHGFDGRDTGDPSGDDMRGTVTVKDSEGRTVESHDIKGMTIGG